jgi:hypothetical protein
MLRGGQASSATSPRMTTLAFPSHNGGRADWTPEERAAEVAEWADFARAPDAQLELDRFVAASALRNLSAMTLYALEAQDRIADAERRFTTVTASRWWRLGRRLRPGLRGREQ